MIKWIVTATATTTNRYNGIKKASLSVDWLFILLIVCDQAYAPDHESKGDHHLHFPCKLEQFDHKKVFLGPMGYFTNLSIFVFWKRIDPYPMIIVERQEIMKQGSYHISFLLVMIGSLFAAGCTLPLCTRPEYIVTRTDDMAGGSCTVSSCTLRQAVYASNVCSGEQTIHIPAGTYRLTLAGADENENATGDLDITGQVRIVGEGMPVIDGNGTDRIFDIQPGATVEMGGLVIQNGFGGDGIGLIDGGGITNAGNLTGTGLLIWNNVGRVFGTYAGAGLANTPAGNAFISHSAIILNTSGEGAGGISNYGNMTLDNVTISGNVGYGILNAGPSLEISYSTITQNVSPPHLLGIVDGYRSFQIHGTAVAIYIRNSIVGGDIEAGGCWGGEYYSQGFNIEYSLFDTTPLDSCEFNEPSDMRHVDPMLLPLRSYDGSLLPIHALDAGSPAIDSADPSNCSGTDQRGVARPQGSGCDRGAYERDIPLTTMITVAPVMPTLDAGRTLTPPPFIVPSVVIPNEIPCLPCILVIQVPANCRQGPGVEYPVINSVLPGEQIEVLGRNQESSWWYSKVDNDKCWISNVAGTPPGDLNLLTIVQAPPTLIPTETQASSSGQPTATTEIDFDKDGYGVSMDCNDKNSVVHPGAAETPDDKLDSNCNGDDDT
jgi:hypothetical protein